MPVERLLPDADARQFVALVAQFARERLAPVAARMEEDEEFPRELLRELGRLGLFAMPYSEELGGLGQPSEVFLQALEEAATAWMIVGLGASVHVMTCYPIATWGTSEQQAQLPDLLGGELLGAFAMSEPQAGSDMEAIATKALRDGADYLITGEKAWISHGGQADYYLTFARTSPGPAGLSCFFVPADAPGLEVGPPERKMGMWASPTTPLHYDRVRVPADSRIGAEGQGSVIAQGALAGGRLGVAACATGLAQAALDQAVAYAGEREQFGQRIGDFQGLRFLLAEMAAKVGAARACYVYAARKRDAGLGFGADAAVAKLIATDAAMAVTTDAIQVLGGYGYTRDFPVERYFREAKVTQIFEGTNQIQRLVIARSLLGRRSEAETP